MKHCKMYMRVITKYSRVYQVKFVEDCRLKDLKGWLSRLILESKGMRAERARKSNKRPQLWLFPLSFSKSRAFGMLHPPKRYVVLKVLTENKWFYFSKNIRDKLLRNCLVFEVCLSTRNFIWSILDYSALNISIDMGILSWKSSCLSPCQGMSATHGKFWWND